MPSIEESSTMKNYSFDIKVALIGYVRYVIDWK